MYLVIRNAAEKNENSKYNLLLNYVPLLCAHIFDAQTVTA